MIRGREEADSPQARFWEHAPRLATPAPVLDYMHSVL